MPHLLRRSLLIVNGAIALTVGAFLFFQPEALFALNGVALSGDPNLMSEVRAPGGVLLLAAPFIFAAAFVSRWQGAALGLSALVYLGYGAARTYSIAVDGLPANDLVWAMGIEWALGMLSLTALASRGASSQFYRRNSAAAQI